MKQFIKNRILAFRAAFKGIYFLIRNETHFQIHLLAAIIALGAAWYFPLEPWEWTVIVLSIGLVWTTEALNTSVEYWTDLAEQKHLPLAGLIKDLAAAAVLLSVFTALSVGSIIFLPKFLELF